MNTAKIKVGSIIPPMNLNYFNRQSKTYVSEEIGLVVEKIIKHRQHTELKCIVGTDVILGYKTLWIKYGKIVLPDSSKRIRSITMPVEADVKIINYD